MNLISLLALLLVNIDFATALQLASGTSEVSRRSALTQLVSSSAAAATSSLWLPPSACNANAAETTAVTLNSGNKKVFPLASFGLQIYSDDVAYDLTLTGEILCYGGDSQTPIGNVSPIILIFNTSCKVGAKVLGRQA